VAAGRRLVRPADGHPDRPRDAGPGQHRRAGGLWANAAELIGWALFAGRRAELGRVELVLYVAVSAAIGVARILLKILLH
jgi:hypothetical protein